jgi:hypothetical protein
MRRKRIWMHVKSIANSSSVKHVPCLLRCTFRIQSALLLSTDIRSRTRPSILGFNLLMGALDDAITALDVLGVVLQAVPLVGENLKAATELTAKICEQVKVRSLALAHSRCTHRMFVL